MLGSLSKRLLCVFAFLSLGNANAKRKTQMQISWLIGYKGSLAELSAAIRQHYATKQTQTQC